MDELQLSPDAGIGEEQVSSSAPFVRALAVQRLEMIWRACEPHINISPDDYELGHRPDPRFIESGIRVIDRLSGLYGLLKPIAAAPTAAGEDREQLRTRAEQLIMELEERVANQD
jgi:hypothetical protein